MIDSQNRYFQNRHMNGSRRGMVRSLVILLTCSCVCGVAWAGEATRPPISDLMLDWAKDPSLVQGTWTLADPADTSIRFAGSHTTGLVKSVDGGATWLDADAGLPAGVTVLALAFDSMTGVTHAGTDTGLYQSHDGGWSWHRFGGKIGPMAIVSLAIDADDPSQLFAGTSTGGLLNSRDHGNTWRFANRASWPLDQAGDLPETLLPWLLTPAPKALPLAAGSDSLVINEVDHAHDDLDDREFVEILNLGDAAVDLGQYALRTYFYQFLGSPRFDRFQLEPVMLQPGEYFVVCRDGDTSAHCDMHVMPSGTADFLRDVQSSAVGLVYSPTGVAGDDSFVDSVCYVPFKSGNGVSGGLAGGSWTEGICIQESDAGADAGFSRIANVDGDNNERDFRSTCLTPGRANAASLAACDEGGQELGTLLITEADVNQPGHPDAAEFLEIKNAGSGTVTLSDYNLRHLAFDWWALLIDLTLDLPDVQLAPGEYFVLCKDAAMVPECDAETLFTLSDNNGVLALVNSPNDADLDQILIDSFVYGEFYSIAMPPAPRGLPWIEGSLEPTTDGSTALMAPEGESYTRVGDVDTDDNAADFALLPITPGAGS